MSLMTLEDKVERRKKANQTARSRKGKEVKSVDALIVLALDGRAVFCDNAWGLLPAEAVLNMPVWVVAGAINKGRVYAYPAKVSRNSAQGDLDAHA